MTVENINSDSSIWKPLVQAAIQARELEHNNQLFIMHTREAIDWPPFHLEKSHPDIYNALMKKSKLGE